MWRTRSRSPCSESSTTSNPPTNPSVSLAPDRRASLIIDVGTTELTKSFGWKGFDSFLQHDVQEFNRVLCDKLETKMKGTTADGEIKRIFAGTMKSYIKCIDIDFESARSEDFYGPFSPSSYEQR